MGQTGPRLPFIATIVHARALRPARAETSRTREIGIRSAVGATPGQVRSLIVREGMTVVLAGTAVGGLGAVGAASSVRHLLYGLEDGDVFVYAGAIVLVVAAGWVACRLPARRAAAMDPMAALREQ